MHVFFSSYMWWDIMPFFNILVCFSSLIRQWVQFIFPFQKRCSVHYLTTCFGCMIWKAHRFVQHSWIRSWLILFPYRISYSMAPCFHFLVEKWLFLCFASANWFWSNAFLHGAHLDVTAVFKCGYLSLYTLHTTYLVISNCKLFLMQTLVYQRFQGNVTSRKQENCFNFVLFFY